MKLDHFVKDRKVARRLGLKTSPKKGTGGINDCFTPSNESSKPDLKEFHQEDLKLRRRHQLARQPNVALARCGKNDDPAYRKSIWPQRKIAKLRSVA